MQVIEQTAIIQAPMATVIEAVHDIEGIPTWATVHSTVEPIPGSSPGTTFNWCFEVGKLNFKGQLEVIERTDRSLITKTTGDVNSIWAINLTPISKNRTAIQVSVEYALPHAFIEPLVDIAVQQLANPEVANENMNRFKAMVETHARMVQEEALAPR